MEPGIPKLHFISKNSWRLHCKPVPISTLICFQRVESGSTDSNMLHLGSIQLRKSKEMEKYKCASRGAYLTQLSRILPS
jgi:hypothetical protein